jgi:hypothetical protein
MKSKQPTGNIIKRTILSSVVFASMFLSSGTIHAQGRTCSNATLQGGYGFFSATLILPARTPRALIGRWDFDGVGKFTNTLIFNDNGTITRTIDSGTYTVNPDCSGRIFTSGGTRTLEIMIVDAGNEFYELRTDPASVVGLFNAAKKVFPGNGQDQAHGPNNELRH